MAKGSIIKAGDYWVLEQRLPVYDRCLRQGNNAVYIQCKSIQVAIDAMVENLERKIQDNEVACNEAKKEVLLAILQWKKRKAKKLVKKNG